MFKQMTNAAVNPSMKLSLQRGITQQNVLGVLKDKGYRYTDHIVTSGKISLCSFWGIKASGSV